MARKFYYDDGNEKHGPVSGDELVRLREEGSISNDTWVRREDNGTWRPLGTVDLHAEEEEARNPSILGLLRRNGLLGPAILFVLAAVVIIVLAMGLVAVSWPVILIIMVIWLCVKMRDGYYR